MQPAASVGETPPGTHGCSPCVQGDSREPGNLAQSWTSGRNQGSQGPASRSHPGRTNGPEPRLCPSWGRDQAAGSGPVCHRGGAVLDGGPASSSPSPPPGRPLPLGAQGQVELADGLQELPLQCLVGHPAGQRELELVVDDTLGLAGHDCAVEVTQPLDGLQLAWRRQKEEAPSCIAETFAGSEAPCSVPASVSWGHRTGVRLAVLLKVTQPASSLCKGPGVREQGREVQSDIPRSEGTGRARHECPRDSTNHLSIPQPGGSGQALPHLDTVSAPRSSSRPDSSCSHTELTRQGALTPPGCRRVRRGQSRVPSLGPPAPASRGPCAFVKPGSKPTALLSFPKTRGLGTGEEKDERPWQPTNPNGPQSTRPRNSRSHVLPGPLDRPGAGLQNYSSST